MGDSHAGDLYCPLRYVTMEGLLIVASPIPCIIRYLPATPPHTPHLTPQFDIPATYPTTAPEIELPELDGKTAKMYRGGKICLTIHFKPLWAKNRWGGMGGCSTCSGY